MLGAKVQAIIAKDSERVEVIQIEGQVVLNIAKHCAGTEHTGKTRTGQLYGLKTPVTGLMEVTYSIATPDGHKTRKDDRDFCKKVMECVEKTGVDNMEMGWYRSTTNGSWLEESTVQRCSEWQTDMANDTVLIVYDPGQTKNGRLALKAYQLTKQFHALHASGDRSRLGHTSFFENEISYRNVFREIPIKIHNPYLVHAFLFDLKLSCGYDRLTHADNSDVSRNLMSLEKCIDEYGSHQNDYKKWIGSVTKVKKDRDRARKETDNHRVLQNIEMMYPFPPEPSRLRSVLAVGQMADFAEKMKNSVIGMHAKMQIQAPLNGTVAG